MIRTSSSATQRCNSTLAATEPGALEHGATQPEFASRGSWKVGHASFKSLFIAAVTATMFCTSARAAICEGPIGAVAVWADGRVFVRQGTAGLNSPIWEICNINSSTGYEPNVTSLQELVGDSHVSTEDRRDSPDLHAVDRVQIFVIGKEPTCTTSRIAAEQAR